VSNTSCDIPPPILTFSHRSGVTPYTSSCELAGSCVFGKQLPGILSLRLFFTCLAALEKEQALSLTYGRFFAEFLRGKSLVPLGLLALSTCVGFRYGYLTLVLLNFSRKALHKRQPGKFLTFSRYSLNLVQRMPNQ
jgi:hypothetical protein